MEVAGSDSVGFVHFRQGSVRKQYRPGVFADHLEVRCGQLKEFGHEEKEWELIVEKSVKNYPIITVAMKFIEFGQKKKPFK